MTPTFLSTHGIDIMKYDIYPDAAKNSLLANAMVIVNKCNPKHTYFNVTVDMTTPTEMVITSTHDIDRSNSMVTSILRAMLREVDSTTLYIEYAGNCCVVEWDKRTDEDGTVEYEEGNSYFLVAPGYHTFDDTYRKQCEKQLFIAKQLYRINYMGEIDDIKRHLNGVLKYLNDEHRASLTTDSDTQIYLEITKTFRYTHMIMTLTEERLTRSVYADMCECEELEALHKSIAALCEVGVNIAIHVLENEVSIFTATEYTDSALIRKYILGFPIENFNLGITA